MSVESLSPGEMETLSSWMGSLTRSEVRELFDLVSRYKERKVGELASLVASPSAQERLESLSTPPPRASTRGGKKSPLSFHASVGRISAISRMEGSGSAPPSAPSRSSPRGRRNSGTSPPTVEGGIGMMISKLVVSPEALLYPLTEETPRISLYCRRRNLIRAPPQRGEVQTRRDSSISTPWPFQRVPRSCSCHYHNLNVASGCTLVVDTASSRVFANALAHCP